MKSGASQAEVSHMVERVEQMGLKPHVIEGTERTVIAVIGDHRQKDKFRESLEIGAGVEDVVPILAPYKMASTEVKPERSVVRAGSLSVGGGKVGMIAGPCSVEGEEQIIGTARAVRAAGATALRGGAFKPRTSPYSFQGLKEDGPPICSPQPAKKPASPSSPKSCRHRRRAQLVSEYADVLQIGARNMQNYRLLEAAGGIERRRPPQTRSQRHHR